MNPIKIIRYHVYLLQLENYNLERYWKLVLKRPFSVPAQFRQNLVLTPKLGMVFVIAVLVQILAAYLVTSPLARSDVYLGIFPTVFMFVFLFFSMVFFVFLGAATLALRPIDYAIKQFIIMQAKNKMDNFQDLKIIAITGSYGKTTMKEILATILGEKFKVLKTPESVNTPVGISRLILKDLTPDDQTFFVEMVAYARGDVQALCEIARPDIAILTGINEAHLERFGTIENTIAAKFEITENARDNASVILNQDDERVMASYKNRVGSRNVFFYSKNKSEMSEYPKISLLGDYV